VAAGSDQVSQSSQKLAEGTSEQAASIEETSFPLEEMSSMTRQNAQNAKEAKTMMEDIVGDMIALVGARGKGDVKKVATIAAFDTAP